MVSGVTGWLRIPHTNASSEADVTRTAKTCWVTDLGLISYAAASELQHQLVEARKARAIPDVLLLCEHPHVITLGRNGHREHLRASEHLLAQMNVEFHPTDRGGDITYHGPGQIVGYPILDLAEHRRDIRWYVDALEEVMIRASADFGVAARRREGCRGVWVEDSSARAADKEAKIGALGVHLSRWVSSHGFAYNVSTDLRFYDLIVPCGIVGKGVTSLERILGRAVSPQEVSPRVTSHFAAVFDRRLETVSRDALGEILTEALAAQAAGAGRTTHGAATLVEQS
jgi:lipoyl(octanoyl) transferase